MSLCGHTQKLLLRDRKLLHELLYGDACMALMEEILHCLCKLAIEPMHCVSPYQRSPLRSSLSFDLPLVDNKKIK